ncbi:hypothetical protein AGMMS49573_03740 [Endomicrobiia bacterium]|nr:hypothetical protein AGMMS49573_03740 [Endomicrobiia bacterium]
MLDTDRTALDVMLSDLQRQLTQLYQLQELLLLLQEPQEQLLQRQLQQRLLLAQERQQLLQLQISHLRQYFLQHQTMPFLQIEYLGYQHRLTQQLLQQEQQL